MTGSNTEQIKWVKTRHDTIKPYLGGREIFWAPLPGSQTAFMTSPYFDTLYISGRGIGKTSCLLYSYLGHVGKGYRASWRGLILRRKMGELKDIIISSKEIVPKLFPKAKYNGSEYTWTFPEGETLTFSYLNGEKDATNYQGQQYPFLGFEELCSFPDREPVDMLLACVRPPPGATHGLPLMVRSTANPYGVGLSWVVDKYGLVDNSKMISKVLGALGKQRVAIFGKLEENIVLLDQDPHYRETIREAAGGNKDREKAWLTGDISVNSGGFFSDYFESRYNIIPHLAPKDFPRGWSISKGYDHGKASPFATVWVATSDGTPVTVNNNRKIGGVKGDKIIFHEYYGSEIGPNGKPSNKGLRLSVADIAANITSIEQSLGIRSSFDVADSAIWGSQDSLTPESEFRKHGIYWKKSAKERIPGWEYMCDLLMGAKPESTEEGPLREKPGLFIMDNCNYLINNLLAAPKDDKKPGDIDTKVDHDLDAARYVLYTKRKKASSSRGVGLY